MLSKREIEILKLICEDLPHKLISDKLNISKRTVDVHIGNMIKKLNVKSVIGLVKYSYDIKLIEPKNVSCCNNGKIVCPGCNGEHSKYGTCSGCNGKGIRTCGKCGGENRKGI